MKRIVSPDGRVIEPRVWPARDQRAVVQILHGLAEHIERYGRFAVACNRLGFSVVGHNHRGHGPQTDDGLLGHFDDRDGWSRVIDDAYAVFRAIEREYPDKPIVLLGHSMGSYVAQSLVMRKSPAIAALLLSGSTSPNTFEVRVARWLATILSWTRGRRTLSALLDKMVFQSYNQRFEPTRTAFDWLSRDELEVDRYVDDPFCGSRSSNALWRDLFGGLLEISSRDALSRVPSALPVLISGGEVDPVGGAKALEQLADAYELSGHRDVTLKLYAEGRHEMLNETNRDAVTADWLGWIEHVLERVAGVEGG